MIVKTTTEALGVLRDLSIDQHILQGLVSRQLSITGSLIFVQSASEGSVLHLAGKDGCFLGFCTIIARAVKQIRTANGQNRPATAVYESLHMILLMFDSCVHAAAEQAGLERQLCAEVQKAGRISMHSASMPAVAACPSMFMTNMLCTLAAPCSWDLVSPLPTFFMPCISPFNV